MQESDYTQPNIVLILKNAKTYLYNIKSNEVFNDTVEDAKKLPMISTVTLRYIRLILFDPEEKIEYLITSVR